MEIGALLGIALIAFLVWAQTGDSSNKKSEASPPDPQPPPAVQERLRPVTPAKSPQSTDIRPTFVPSPEPGIAPSELPTEPETLLPHLLQLNYVLDEYGERVASTNDSIAWKAARRNGITATDARLLVKLNGEPRVTKARLASEKTQQDESFELYATSAMQDGIEREPIIAAILQQKYGIAPNTCLVHGENHRHLATPDGFGDDFVVEIKVSMKSPRDIVNRYRDQLQWQMHVTGASRAMFVVEDHDTRDLYSMWILRDQGRIDLLAKHADDVLHEIDVLVNGASDHTSATTGRNNSWTSSEWRIEDGETDDFEPEDSDAFDHARDESDHEFNEVPGSDLERAEWDELLENLIGPATSADIVALEHVHWSTDESVSLLRMYVEGWSLEDMAERFGAVEEALVVELTSWMIETSGELRDHTCPRNNEYWTPDEDRLLGELFRVHANASAVARELGRDQLSIATRLLRLRIPNDPYVAPESM